MFLFTEDGFVLVKVLQGFGSVYNVHLALSILIIENNQTHLHGFL